jgi:hypothetical protein
VSGKMTKNIISKITEYHNIKLPDCMRYKGNFWKIDKEGNPIKITEKEYCVIHNIEYIPWENEI